MKNIHLLPTDKPSRLRYNLSNVLVLTKESYRDYGKQVNQNIYITSDEEIKEGDWVIKKYETKFPKSKANEVLQVNKINTNNGYLPNGNYYNFSNYLTIVVYDRPFQGSNDNDISRKSFNNGFKKIILTTDADLIKDGVQAIPEEFLTWFVENPKCESVEINEKSRCCGRCNGVDDLCYTDMCCDDHHVYGCETCYGKRVEYLLTIPIYCTQKEEPKMNKIQKEIFEMEQELGVPPHLRWHNSKPNQDIIKSEEDAEIFIEAITNPPKPNKALIDAFTRHFGKPENQLYSEIEYLRYSMIEYLIIRWNLDGTRTAGNLTREIMKLIKS